VAANATQVLNIGDAQIAAVVDGCDGAPWLTLLHALATDHRLWDLQVAALSERFRVLRLDMRGHGASSIGVSGAIDLARLAADVRGVWDSLGIHRSSIMGLSIGGMIALELALDHGDRVERMVVADCRADVSRLSPKRRYLPG
jgi:pimeloyl-ACP methyl ester carboxylesterase